MCGVQMKKWVVALSTTIVPDPVPPIDIDEKLKPTFVPLVLASQLAWSTSTASWNPFKIKWMVSPTTHWTVSGVKILIVVLDDVFIG